MKFLSLEPFVPAGADIQKSKELFLALGFEITWDGGDYIGFKKDDCKFILQKYDNKDFAENFMISVRIDDADAFHAMLKENKLEERFGIRTTAPQNMPYGREVNVIDIAGVCWHFVQ